MVAAPSPNNNPLRTLLEKLEASPRLAHRFLFEHRHPDPTPAFHYEMIDDWHGDHPQVVDMAFRGGAKSTTAEEAICTLALFKKFRNGLIIGENVDRAVDRLTAIKTELEQNERILEIFGPQVGPVWGYAKIELMNGVFLQALGREQSLRGVKHKDARPDIAFIDDYEDEESAATPEARQKVRRRFYAVLLPALDKKYKLRVAGTPLDNDALIMRLVRDKHWLARKYPIEFLNEKGEREATWPGRFPLDWIDNKKQQLMDAGEATTWAREYMCEPEDEAVKPFKRSDFVVQNLTHTWEPCYAIYDPARTAKKETSAFTGRVVCSWIGNRIVVWESAGEFWKPDEIVNDLFRVDLQYNPIAIGVEEDGLNEFLLQPIRQAQIARGHPLPIRSLKAPKNKIDFIKGLQPFARAKEIVLAGEQEQLLQQFDAFPRGRIDTINALAFILRVKLGVPVFPSFGYQHVASDLKPKPFTPLFLAVNAGVGATTGVLMQMHDGRLQVFMDWVSEQLPGECLRTFVQEARMLFKASEFRVVAPQEHFTGYNEFGMVAAGRATQIDVHKGLDARQGREEIRSLIERNPGGQTGVQVDMRARWTLRAMTGGYAFDIDKRGQREDEPKDNVYRLLINGLESVMALSRVAGTSDGAPHYAYTGDGKRYLSARAAPRR